MTGRRSISMRDPPDGRHQIYEHLLQHVVLPRVLTKKILEDEDQQELIMVKIMTDSVRDSYEWIPDKTVQIFNRFELIQNDRTEETVAEQINALLPGETFAILLREQQTVFMIHMPTNYTKQKNSLYIMSSDESGSDSDEHSGDSDGRENVKASKSKDRTKTVTIATFPSGIEPKDIYKDFLKYNCLNARMTFPSYAMDVEYSELMRSNDFAHQLCCLYRVSKLPKKHYTSNHCNGWLAMILSQDRFKENQHFPKITKKVRDEAVDVDGTNQNDRFYFHRLDVYMTMKVLLQHSLTMEMDADESLIVYKVCMLRFITKLCAKYDQLSISSKLNVDLMSEMLAKIARRIEKLLIIKNNSIFPSNINQFYDEVVNSAKETITKVRAHINQQIDQLQGKYAKKAELYPLKDLNFDRDTNQKVAKLRKYLAERNSVVGENRNIDMTSRHLSGYKLRPRRQQTVPTFEHCKSNNPMENVHLSDNENWILYQLNVVDEPIDCNQLQKWYNEYMKRAEEMHSDDPIGISRMMLVRLKLLWSIDQAAIKKHPMLLEHRINIDVHIFDILLLPHSIDMKIAHELCAYFEHRNENARFPGLIEEREITSNSFSVRFASKNAEMQGVLREINNATEEEIQEKKNRWEACRKKSQELRQTISNLNCTQLDADMEPNALEQHRMECEKCKMDHQIESLKISQYQHPLPESPDLQNAILFELRIPNEIAILRDILHSTVKFGQNPGIKMHSTGDWIERETLQQYNQSNQRNVNLTSDNVMPSISYHIDEHDNFDEWIVKNSLNCVFHEVHIELFSSFKFDAIKAKCTLTVEPESVYAGLQWTLNTTTHTQNQVFARQFECPQNLTIAKFIEFGSLRADGHNLQLRKLYAMITTETLSFDQSSVLSLVLQTIWETGVAGNDGYARESHVDFINPQFIQTMIESLEKFVDRQSDNWARPTKLLVAVFITMRIFEMTDLVPDELSIENERIVDRLVLLIDKIRATVIDWLKRIQDILHRGRIQSQDDEKSLRGSMALVSITTAMTFFVNANHTFFKKIISTNATNHYTAPRTWLQAIVTLNNNMLMNDNIQTKSKLNLKMLCKLVRNIGIQIESSINGIIQADPSDVYELIKQQWPLASTGEFLGLSFSMVSKQTIMVDVQFHNETKQVSIDMITGLFLVNGLPIDRLPHNIITNPLYQRIFGDYSFEVQPDEQKFSTVHDFDGHIYEFGWRNGKDLIIKELNRRDNQLFELIPHETFENEIPEILIKEHSHWWNEEYDIIQFRPNEFTDKHFHGTEYRVKYELNLKSNQLTQTKTSRPMLDIESESYNKIKTYLSRLEQPKNILVFRESTKVAKIELFRMNLKFRIDISKSKDDGSVDMLSNEFSRVRVSLQQNCGTLYGLKHGLLLESIPDMNGRSPSKLIIIPHAHIKSKRSPSHTSAEIDLDGQLRNPSYHRYEINETMRTLEPSNGSFSAWFYLAYLHAITSHGEPEPLTGMSGTERALQILQSSFVWSSAPYDTEAIQTLQMIASLTPDRHLSNRIQTIKWPQKIHRHSAQDSFFFIVNQLVGDSQRLGELHFHNEKNVELKNLKNLELNRRDYLRCLPLKPNIQVQDIFIERPMLQTKSLNPLMEHPLTYSFSVRKVASLYHKDTFSVPKNFSLMEFLTKDGKCLDGLNHIEKITNYMNHVEHNITFRNMWISLYEIARSQRLNDEEFVILWSLVAYDGAKLEPLLVLQAVAKNPDSFRNINPPDIREFSQPNKQFSSIEVTKILVDYYAGPLHQNRGHDTSADIEEIKEYVQSKWPCDEISLNRYRSNIATRFNNFYKAGRELNDHLRIWNDNRKLKIFIDKIQGRLAKLKSGNVKISQIKLRENDDIENRERFVIDLEKKIRHQMDHCNEKTDAVNAWQSEHNLDHRTADEWWSTIKNTVNTDVYNKHLIDAGMYPRFVPSLILPKIACTKLDSNPNQIAIIGALATAIAREQREQRNQINAAIPTERSSQLRKSQLNRRAEIEPHVNWKPCDYPEWLLFEIERNLTIRPIQIDVAKQMIDPPVRNDVKHSVMQLNMGEGKTAVIVPILAAYLADGNQQCQIIVLKSLFATNLNTLRQYLGGMLNRRIYIFPCRRDMPMAESISKMLQIYEECKRMKGVILTLPEYLLSFQLKMYESVQKGDAQAAREFLVVHKWMNENVRNILDESDAILNPKYQLIYTIGNQRSLDAGSKRWIIAQAVLNRVPHHMRKLYEQQQDNCDDDYVEAKVEYDKHYLVNAKIFGADELDYRPDIFTPCRILDEETFDELAHYLIDDFINGDLDLTFPAMSSTEQTMVKDFLISKNCSAELSNAVQSQFADVNFDTLLILSGLLSFGILKLILMRRWRVNYGVNEKGTRKMAIPFKAKDVPAEMTDFGHPDVAICFTQLSYYYSGLSHEQLYEVFDVLNPNPNASSIYEKWIGTIPPRLRDPSIETYSSINLEDPTQRNERLFPLMRYNMNVIDFWLSTKVYPREAKTFEKKLICTAWDLCSESLKHRVTGFSGTNDTKNILPLPVAQNDLDSLQQTNEKLLKTLLKPENEKYYALPANVNANYILQKLVHDSIPALFDAGALMLELSNKEMAIEWLKIAPSTMFDAAIYFDSKDVPQTIDRNGVIIELNTSVYRDNLIRCLVYVDDAHIRGTDLKFPDKRKGCVTLSGDITRDKTVQACMRMRQLGNGHVISFWASHEADARIKKVCDLSADDHPTNEHVIDFICENSEQFERDNMPYWLSASHNYTKKLAGHMWYENDEYGNNAIVNLSNKCLDDEFVTLKDMYESRQDVQLRTISAERFQKLIIMYMENDSIVAFIEKIEKDVRTKLEMKEIIHSHRGLDEEQEKEIEHEFETQEQVERPQPMRPACPNFNKDLHNLFLNGTEANLTKLQRARVIVPISRSLTKTNLYKDYLDEHDAWSTNLHVTRDFIRVLNDKSRSYDDYLRPVWWIAGVQIDSMPTQWVLLSSFECDQLISIFKKSENATLLMYRARTSKTQDNLLHERRLQVTAMENPLAIDLRSEVEIGVYAGSMYFKTEAEQREFCGFLGLVPKPRTPALGYAFQNNIIEPNGFVLLANRTYSGAIKDFVGDCRFINNPCGLVSGLIGAHQQLMRRESHVASIVDRGVKMIVEVIQEAPDVIIIENGLNNNCERRKRMNSNLETDVEVTHYWKRPKLEPLDTYIF